MRLVTLLLLLAAFLALVNSRVVNFNDTLHVAEAFDDTPGPCFLCEAYGEEGTACGPGREGEWNCAKDRQVEPPSQLGVFSGGNTINNGSVFPYTPSVIEAGDKQLQWTIDADRYIIYFDSYPSCTTAALKDVARWFGFPSPTSSDSCSLELRQREKGQVDSTDYQSDHVFEAQTMLHFFMWLGGDFTVVGWPEGYERPSIDWIFEQLLGYPEDQNPRTLRWNERSLWQNMVMEMGNYENLDRMAILQSRVNGMKGTLFRSWNTATIPGPYDEVEGLRINEIKIQHRNYAGVFQYLNLDIIHNIFTTTSKALEDVLQEFDSRYGWDEEGMLIRPERIEGQPKAGLRDLWCFFMEVRLTEIDLSGQRWSAKAKADVEKVNLKTEDDAERKRWLTRFDNGGILSAESLQLKSFPQTIGTDGIVQSSRYGVWDNGPAGPW